MIPKHTIVVSVLSLTALCACTSATPYLDANLGAAVNAAKAQQTMNPQASRNTDPVAGIGGVPAEESITRYHDSFKTPPPTFEVITGGAAGGR